MGARCHKRQEAVVVQYRYGHFRSTGEFCRAWPTIRRRERRTQPDCRSFGERGPDARAAAKAAAGRRDAVCLFSAGDGTERGAMSRCRLQPLICLSAALLVFCVKAPAADLVGMQV